MHRRSTQPISPRVHSVTQCEPTPVSASTTCEALAGAAAMTRAHAYMTTKAVRLRSRVRQQRGRLRGKLPETDLGLLEHGLRCHHGWGRRGGHGHGHGHRHGLLLRRRLVHLSDLRRRRRGLDILDLGRGLDILDTGLRRGGERHRGLGGEGGVGGPEGRRGGREGRLRGLRERRPRRRRRTRRCRPARAPAAASSQPRRRTARTRTPTRALTHTTARPSGGRLVLCSAGQRPGSGSAGPSLAAAAKRSRRE